LGTLTRERIADLGVAAAPLEEGRRDLGPLVDRLADHPGGDGRVLGLRDEPPDDHDPRPGCDGVGGGLAVDAAGNGDRDRDGGGDLPEAVEGVHPGHLLVDRAVDADERGAPGLGLAGAGDRVGVPEEVHVDPDAVVPPGLDALLDRLVGGDAEDGRDRGAGLGGDLHLGAARVHRLRVADDGQVRELLVEEPDGGEPLGLEQRGPHLEEVGAAGDGLAGALQRARVVHEVERDLETDGFGHPDETSVSAARQPRDARRTAAERADCLPGVPGSGRIAVCLASPPREAGRRGPTPRRRFVSEDR
jgi:hypothetical protein